MKNGRRWDEVGWYFLEYQVKSLSKLGCWKDEAHTKNALKNAFWLDTFDAGKTEIVKYENKLADSRMKTENSLGQEGSMGTKFVEVLTSVLRPAREMEETRASIETRDVR